MSYMMLSGFGGIALGGFGAASSFSAEAVWTDCLAGSSCKTGKEPTCGASKRCGQSVQAALNALGYGPLTVDGQIGPASMSAIKKYSLDNGFGALVWPTKAMLIKMEEQLSKGEKPGPGAAIDSHVVGGEFVPGSGPGGLVSTMGMSTGMMLGLGALALVGVGVLALIAKKKRGAPGGTTKFSSVRI